MAEMMNVRIALVAKPVGVPKISDFELREEPVVGPAEGSVTVAVEYLSIDAFIRTALNPGSLHREVPLGSTVSAIGVGRVTESNDPSLSAGDAVMGGVGAQTLATLPARMLRKVDDRQVPLRWYLGPLGMTTGVTAYFGMRDVGQVTNGDTVAVSAAAGAVGSVAGQIARLSGAERVIGIAGGPHKVEFLTSELGYDAGIDYKGEDVNARLRELAPGGVNVFFDNVGGPILDAVLDNIAQRARVVICGAISQYNDFDNITGPSLYLRLAERYSRMEGFTVMHFADRFDEAHDQLSSWLDSGELVLPEQIEQGIERFPETLLRLLNGGHMGKLMIAIDPASA